MNKKLQIFISSTFTDLKEERQTAVEAILDAGHIPAGMELFKAGKSQMKTIRKWIDDSDVYMLILGGRYGSIEKESGLSYTELEYRYALSKDMPVFAIVLNDCFLHIKASSYSTDNIFETKNKLKYNSFKKFVKTNVVRFASNIDQISSNIHLQINYIMNDKNYNLIGWIKGNSIDSSSSLLPPNIITSLDSTHFICTDINMPICPQCFLSIKKLTPVPIEKSGYFSCRVCGYTSHATKREVASYPYDNP